MVAQVGSDIPNLDLFLQQGADFDFTMEWLKDDGTPMDLTNYAMRLSIVPSSGSAATLTLDSASTTGSRIALGGTAGTATFYFAHADTALLTPVAFPAPSIAQGLQGHLPLGYHDLKYTDPQGNIGYLFRGPAEFAQRYTA